MQTISDVGKLSHDKEIGYCDQIISKGITHLVHLAVIYLGTVEIILVQSWWQPQD